MRALLMMAGLGLVVGCSPAPAEAAWIMKTQNVLCDRLFACLDADQRKLQFSFYLGSSSADCKAAYGEARADLQVGKMFGVRTLAQSQADKCTDTISKLDCLAIKQLAARSLSATGSSAAESVLVQASKEALAKLGIAEDFKCTTADGKSCRADAYCALSANNGDCAQNKIAPFKDGNLAAKENEAYSAAGSFVGCGTFPIDL